jgi:hypothetical protein
MNSFLKASTLSFSALILTACAGGGGGGGGGGSSAGGVTVTPFTSWSAIQPNTTVQAVGGSTQSSYTANPITGRVNSIVYSGQSTTGASYTATYDSNTVLSSFTIQSAQGATISLSKSAGDTFLSFGAADYARNSTASTEAIAINPSVTGWNYQSYGVWITGQGTGSGTAGAVSVGSATLVTGIPATGNATFSGLASGVYVDPVGQAYLTNGSMSAATNFGSRSIVFSTSGTQAASFNGGNAVSAPLLNMSGTLTYASGSGSFGGAITTTGGLSGNAIGKFYGPNANEMGGTFAATGTGIQSFSGAFGGKR